MATGTFYDAWGPTNTATDSSVRYHQNHLKVTWSSDNEKVTYTVNAYARSGNGSGSYYMSNYGVTVTLYYSLNGGSWQSLGSVYGTLNYNDNVANITKTVTINRTHSSQTIKFAADNTGNYLNSVSHQTGNDTIGAKPSYTISYNVNGGSGTIASQTKWYNETLTLTTNKPTYSGHSFSKWTTNQDGSGTVYSSGGSYTANAATTLYAQWTVDYIDPTIGSVTVTRCDSSGQEQENGTSAKVIITWSTDSNYAGSKCEISYKESSETTYGTTITKNNLSGSSGTIEERIDGNFDIKKSYMIKVVLTDTHDGTAVNYGGVPVCFAFLQFLTGGTGIAIGKYASVPNKIETTFPVIIQSSNITDGVTPSTDIGTKSLLFLDNNGLTTENELGWCDSRFEINNQLQFTRLFAKRTITTDNTTNEYFNGIYMGLKNDGSPIVALNNYKNKYAWQKALEPDILFEGAIVPNGTSPATLQLNSSAANYNHMRIYYKRVDSLKPESSVEVFNPNGKYVNLFTGYAGYNSGLYWPAATDIYINGTEITRRYSYQTNNSTTTVRTMDPGSDTTPLQIIYIEAWNDSWWG